MKRYGRLKGQPRLFYGWYIVALAFLISSVGVFANTYILTVVQLPMAQALGTTRTALLAVITVRTLVSVVISPFVGAIADRSWSTKVLLAGGGSLAGVALILSGFVTAVWQLYVLQIVMTLGLAGGDILALTLVTRWFVRKRGRALGLSTMGLSAGSVVLIPLASVLVADYGWSAAWFLTGSLLMAIYVLGGLVIAKPWPQTIGLTADGIPASATDGYVSTRSGNWTARQAVRTRTLWLLTFTSNFISFASVGVLFTVPAYAADSGVPTTLATIALTAYPIGTAVARPLWALLGERVAPRRVYYGTITGLSICLVLLGVGGPGILIVALSFFAGVFQAANIPLQNMMLADFYGTNAFGAILGLTRPVTATVTSLSPVLPALIHDALGSYSAAFLGFAVLNAAGIVMIRAAQVPTLPTAARETRPQFS